MQHVQCRLYYKKIYKDKKSAREIKELLDTEIYDYDVNGDGNFARGEVCAFERESARERVPERASESFLNVNA